MKLVRDIYAAKRLVGQPVISFEFFPPKTDEGDRTLFEKTIPALLALKPDFCSVTYGAGGTTRDKTLLIVDRIQKQHGLTAVAHLTCVNHTQEQVRELLAQIRALGVKNILALRGDPPNGGEFTNQGIELSLTATPVDIHNGFQWVSTTSFYRNYSVVNSLPEPAFDLQNGGGGSLGTFRIQVGRSVSQVVGQNNGPDGQPIQAGDAQPSYVMNFNNEFTFHRFHAAALVV